LGAVVTLVDAVNAAGQIERLEGFRQIAAADRLVMTKTDLVPQAATQALAARLAAMNPVAELCDVHGDWSFSWLMPEGVAIHKRPPRLPPASSGDESHTGTVRAFALSFDQPIDWTVFGLWLTMLLHRHGQRILRVKGILHIAGEDRPVAVHGVQHLVHPPLHMQRWPSADRGSRIVFIVDGVGENAIRRSLAAFCRLTADGAAPEFSGARADDAVRA